MIFKPGDIVVCKYNYHDTKIFLVLEVRNEDMKVYKVFSLKYLTYPKKKGEISFVRLSNPEWYYRLQDMDLYGP